MKVILKADVKGSGKKGDIIEVSDGYGKNFLVKKGLAEVATASGINEATQKKAAAAYHRAEEIKAQQALAAAINGKTVPVKIKVSENGKVFGSITTQHVAQALADMGFEIDKRKSKTLGSFPAEVRLMENVSAKITVSVEAL